MDDVTVEDVQDYLGRTDLDQDMLQGVLDAERASQRGKCRIPSNYPADLREALLRRVARNLSMRNLINTTEVETGAVFSPSNDPEVRRLENGYRRVLLA